MSAEKFKKIAKKFLLSDNSVNTHGFRLLTSGYQLNDYKRNPIGYFMHERDKGVLVKWEDLTVENDSVFGFPVINMAHPRAQQTIDEIENGFLNAASVGHIIALEISSNPADVLPNQTGPTVTKWFNRECSLCDIPGNYNSLVLFDKDDKQINLADFSNNQLQNTMKQIFFTLAHLAAMNLKAEATEVEIGTAFNDLVAKAAKAEGLQTQLTDLNKKVKTDEVKGLLNAALTAKKITEETRKKLEVDYATNSEGLKNLIDSLPAYKSVIEDVKVPEVEMKDLMAKSWDALMESGEMATLKAKAPELWKQKYKEAFGSDPK